MLNRKQLNSVIGHQKNIMMKEPWHREGQAFYLALSQLFDNCAIMIAGTEYDPYYDDSKLSKCKKYLLGEIK